MIDETSDRTPLLVLGLGNVLCGDDGAGVEAVHRLLADYEIDPRVLVLDGGTLGLSLLPYLRSAARALLVDAVSGQDAPGTLLRLDGDEVAGAASRRMSCHQIGVADLLDAGRLLGDIPPMVLMGVIASSVELLAPPTEAVRAAIPALADAVAGEIRALGFEVRRRRVPLRRSSWDSGVGDAQPAT